MEGGMKGPGGPQGPGKSDKSSLENSAELKKSAERFCSTHISNDDLKTDREKYVALAYEGKNPALNSYSMQMLEKDLRLPEEPSMMVWVSAPKSLQTHIIKEHPYVQNKHLSDAVKFKDQAVEKFRKSFPEKSWEILSKVSKGFWEVRIADFPVPGTKLPPELEKIQRQVKSARVWANSSIPSSQHTYPEALYSKVNGFNKPKDGKQFGEKLEEVYSAFIKHYATNPKEQTRLFKELDFQKNSKELEDDGYFDTLESAFFSKKHWGEKIENTEDAKVLLSKDVMEGIPPKTMDYYLTGTSKRYQKADMVYFVEFLKDHPNVSWSSLAVMNESSLSTGWFAGGRSASSIETLINTKFSEPIIKDMHDTDRAFMRMPLKDMMSMLPDRDRADVDVFIAKTMNERFKDSGGTENQPIDHIYSELLVRYGRVLPEKGSTGALKAIAALHGGRAKYLETFLGINIAPFEHIQRTLVKIEHMAEQARLAPDVATKNHFALRARMILLEDFDEYTKELQTHMPIPDEYAKIYKGRLYKITEDLEEAERQLRVAGI